MEGGCQSKVMPNYQTKVISNHLLLFYIVLLSKFLIILNVNKNVKYTFIEQKKDIKKNYDRFCNGEKITEGPECPSVLSPAFIVFELFYS